MPLPRLIVASLVLPLFSTAVLRAEIVLDKNGKWKLQGDFRFRFERDWDSKRPDGTLRSDRDRLRIRARVGMTFHPIQGLEFGARLRSGKRTAQQSPHLTIHDFQENPRGPAQMVFDKWFVRYAKGGFWLWGGRNSFPFWKPNELFWDDDVTPAGVAAGYRQRLGEGALALNASFAKLPDGMVDFGGELAAGQAVYTRPAGRLHWTFAGGLFHLDGTPTTVNLRQGNGVRDYTIWVGNVQAKASLNGLPLSLGFDGIHNSKGYSPDDPDPVTASNHDQRTGVDLYANLGQLGRRGEWLVGYSYARIETLAVNASFAQDDWVRWGAQGQTDSSDFHGHEIRLAVALARNMNLVARFYFAKAITSVQDGRRFRIDYNISF